MGLSHECHFVAMSEPIGSGRTLRVLDRDAQTR